ncbi:MAG: nitroreductase family protein [Ilumatobacteraceae bacterium]
MDDHFEIDQTDRLLTTTRAVRKRLDLTREVPRELILDCIRVATQAPAGGNVQRWRWIVIDDPAIKQAIADLYRRAYAPYMATQRRAVEQSPAKPGQENIGAIMDSSDHLANVLQDVPALVIPCSLGAPEGSQGMVAGFYGSILPAVWNFMLAARSRGLGTAWTTLHLEYEAEARAVLGIPPTVTQVALTPVAYYTGETFKPGNRRAAEEITYFNGWKS